MVKILISEDIIHIEASTLAQFLAAVETVKDWRKEKTKKALQDSNGPTQTLARLTLEERQREYLRKVEPTEEQREEARKVLAVYIEEKAKGENAYSAWIKNIEEGVAASIARQEHGSKFQVPGTAEDAESLEA